MSKAEQRGTPVLIATRVDPDLAEELAQIAQRERRSMSAQLALIVEQYLAEQATKKAA